MAAAIRPTLLRQQPRKADVINFGKHPKGNHSSTLEELLHFMRAEDTPSFRHYLVSCPSTLIELLNADTTAERIQGTANDPVPIPDPAPAHGSYHWTFERLIAGALIPLTIAPFASGSLNPALDATLCALILIHSHIGFESIIIDYVPQKRAPTWRRVFMWGLKAGTLIVAVGLYEFETNDVGLTEAIKRIWHA